MHHPDVAQLKGFLDETLEDSLSETIANHLETCPQCEETLVTLVEELESRVGGRASKSIQPEPSERTDSLKDRIAQTLDELDRDSAVRPTIALQLREQIGEGGMGKVYEYHDESLDRPVAVKYMNPQLRGSSAAKQRFLREAQLAAKLGYRGTPVILGTGQSSDGSPFYWMQLLIGDSLDMKVDSCRLSPKAFHRRDDESVRQQLTWVAEIARTVHRAHLRGIIHRDLKPSNILVDRDELPIVIDWGLAKQLDVSRLDATIEDGISQFHQATQVNNDSITNQRLDSAAATNISDATENEASWESGVTQAGSVIGTLEYLAPEMAGSSLGDEQTDIFGLGAILHFVLLGQSPHVALIDGSTSKSEIIEKIRTTVTRRPSTDESLLPPELQSILRRSLNHRPCDRYATANQFAQDLENYLASLNVEAHCYSMSERIRKTASRHALALAGGSIALLFLAGIIGVTAVLLNQARNTTAKALENESAMFDELLDYSLGVIDMSHSIVEAEGNSESQQKISTLTKRLLQHTDSRSDSEGQLLGRRIRLTLQDQTEAINLGSSLDSVLNSLAILEEQVLADVFSPANRAYWLAEIKRVQAIANRKLMRLDEAVKLSERAVDLLETIESPEQLHDTTPIGFERIRFVSLFAYADSVEDYIDYTDALEDQETWSEKLHDARKKVIAKYRELENSDQSDSITAALQVARQRMCAYNELLTAEERFEICEQGLASIAPRSLKRADLTDRVIFLSEQTNVCRDLAKESEDDQEKHLLKALQSISEVEQCYRALEALDGGWPDIADRTLFALYRKTYVLLEAKEMGVKWDFAKRLQEHGQGFLNLGLSIIDRGLSTNWVETRTFSHTMFVVQRLTEQEELEAAREVLRDLCSEEDRIPESMMVGFQQLKAEVLPVK